MLPVAWVLAVICFYICFCFKDSLQWLGFLAILAVFALGFTYYCWRKKSREVEQDRGKDDVMHNVENGPKKQEPTEGVGKLDYHKRVFIATESPESKVEQDRRADDMV